MYILNVKTQLDKLGKSPYWLAKETGISLNHIGKMYRGETDRIYLNTLDKLCKTLQCNVGDIIIYKDDTL